MDARKYFLVISPVQYTMEILGEAGPNEYLIRAKGAEI